MLIWVTEKIKEVIMRLTRVLTFSIILIILCINLSGCTFIFQKGRRTDIEKISQLKSEKEDLEKEMTEMQRAKAALESRLRQEINDKEVRVEMLEKGLVITFLAEVLFDSGKADLREESLERLTKMASVLNDSVKEHSLGIEGHTDNEPIKYSGWKSNWELSAARALSVLHFLIENGVVSTRLNATAFGEFHPIASNETQEGRQKNRRVEVVVLPKVTKQRVH